MPIRKTVRRGDSLWSLAGRYLGSGDRYPQIYDFHNQEAARNGLQPIDKPELIFVGQTILIPPRPKLAESGSGTKAEGSHWPIALNLKVTYTIGRDTPPIIYSAPYGDYSIKAEMSGRIGIENMTPGHFKYAHNYELAMSNGPMQAKQKLRNIYDPALAALTAKPEMVFESGQVKIKAPIATNANLGPYDIKVQAVTPLQMSGALKPPTISGTLEMGKRKYKYCADIEFKIDVNWHQRPKGEPERVKAPEPVEKRAMDQTNSIDWGQVIDGNGGIIATVALIIVGTALWFYTRGTASIDQTTSMTPFTHTIDRRNIRA
jgi:hypothetical protein